MPGHDRDRTVGLITARAGSKGLPHKHLLDLGGRPLVAWTVEAACGATSLDRVVVSTDSKDIATICREGGAEVPFLRPAELAQDDSSHVDVILHALNWLRDEDGYDPRFVMLLQPTSPFRDAQDIDGAIGWRDTHGAASLISVSPAPVHPYFCYRLDDGARLSPYVPDRPTDIRRQDLPAAWQTDGAIFLQGSEHLRRSRSCFPSGSVGYRMPAGHGIQIDTASDMDEARRFLGLLR